MSRRCFTLDKCWNAWRLCALSGLSRCVLCSDRRAGWGSGLPETPRPPSLPRSRCWRPAPEPFSPPSLVRAKTQRHREVATPSVCRPDESGGSTLHLSPPLSGLSGLPEQLCLVVFPVTPLDVVKIRLQAQQTPFHKGQSVLFLPSQAVR